MKRVTTWDPGGEMVGSREDGMHISITGFSLSFPERLST